MNATKTKAAAKTKTETTKAGKTEKKTTKKTTGKTTALKPETNIPDYMLPDGSMLDLASYDWGEYKLTDREKLFVIYYTLPDTATYHNKHAAALKAGYSEKSANVSVISMFKKPKITNLIQKCEENITKTSIKSAYHRYNPGNDETRRV